MRKLYEKYKEHKITILIALVAIGVIQMGIVIWYSYQFKMLCGE